MTFFYTELALDIMYYELIGMVLWFLFSMVVAILTWIDDGTGTLFPGPLGPITKQGAPWKYTWTWHGMIANLVRQDEEAFEKRPNKSKDDIPPLGVSAFLFVNALPFVIVGIAALLWWIIFPVGIAIGIIYGARCIVRARRVQKETATAPASETTQEPTSETAPDDAAPAAPSATE